MEIGGNGPAIRVGIIDPESMLDPLALVGAIEAVVNAVSLAADDDPAPVASRPPPLRLTSAGLGGQSDLSVDWCPPVAPMHTER